MNIDICRTSKDVFDKDIDLLTLHEEAQDQSGKENSAANNLGIFQKDKKKGKMSKEELGPVISSQLTEGAMKYLSEMSKNPVVVNKI